VSSNLDWVSEARAKPLPSESKFQKYFGITCYAK
jgi:hypothetical protein